MVFDPGGLSQLLLEFTVLEELLLVIVLLAFCFSH